MIWKYYFGSLAIMWAIAVFWIGFSNHEPSNLEPEAIGLACICMLICIVGWRLESKK